MPFITVENKNKKSPAPTDLFSLIEQQKPVVSRTSEELSKLSADDLASWGVEHGAEMEYRAELARRIAATFNNADTILMFDNITPAGLDGLTGGDVSDFDRSLLCALWFSTGFAKGGKVLVYAPPNPVEIKSYLKLKKLVEQRLKKQVPIEILYETEKGELLDILELFVKNEAEYTAVCERFAQRPSDQIIPSFRFHLDLIQRHLDIITRNSQCTFVYPYQMLKEYKEELKPYSNKLILPDVPSDDKANHHFLLKSHKFPELLITVGIASDGTTIDDYKTYVTASKTERRKKTPENVKIFAQSIVRAVEHIQNDLHLDTFAIYDASGCGGGTNMSPDSYALLYDRTKSESERVEFLEKHINDSLREPLLPTFGVVEEMEAAEKWPGVPADYGVCGFALNGKFYPTSVNIERTTHGQYGGMWMAAKPDDIDDTVELWQRIFDSFDRMVKIEAEPLSYKNGTYSTDLFVTSDNQLKLRDWNLRRGGHSAPESLIIFGMPNYEMKMTFYLKDFGEHNFHFNAVELFHLYTRVGEILVNEHCMILINTGLGYCGKLDSKGNDFLKFHVLAHPSSFIDTAANGGEGKPIPERDHPARVTELVRAAVAKVLLSN
ncbi:unnamed protein product [Adineta steineri]|uniref:Uncharacterized protein n=1 Tax=Adineta steineri TaxID=433720 RepID=A0A818MYJ7_9BILA|nr:unnamed protein product [Adineta steineri]CAF3596386.1 unnamed protein product [Adineta steineri]